MLILTFDIEEWFHILDNNSTKTINEWKNYEKRIFTNMERIFSLLESNKQKATFFCLGWIGENYPEIIRQIVDKGYEIGSHTRMHQLAYEQNRAEFKKDVEHSIKTLEDISGKKVKYFRAPGFSITNKNLWAFEILSELGIEIDSSVFPAKRAHGGIPSYGTSEPSLIKYNGIQLKEFPINTISVLGKNLVFSGGGYFRLTPYWLINKWSQKADYIMTYFHPRDFDPDQPMINGLSFYRKFKSYVGLKSSEKKLNKWIREFDFIDIKTANEIIDWGKIKTIKL